MKLILNFYKLGLPFENLKEKQGDQIVVVELDNGVKYRFAGPGLQALQTLIK